MNNNISVESVIRYQLFKIKSSSVFSNKKTNILLRTYLCQTIEHLISIIDLRLSFN